MHRGGVAERAAAGPHPAGAARRRRRGDAGCPRHRRALCAASAGGGRHRPLRRPCRRRVPAAAGWDGGRELARSSGLPLAGHLAPAEATTRGVGEVVLAALAALAARATRLVVALGGSASTDGGTGMLRALGLRLLDDHGRELPDGGRALLGAVRVDTGGLVAALPGGVTVLTDVDNPLLGPTGAAAVFGPQKGADPQLVELLDQALSRWAELCRGDPAAPGAGAGGGTAYGLQAVWGATLRFGSMHIADLARLDAALHGADVVLTGEGRFDATSLRGKVCGEVLRRARQGAVQAVVVCGQRGDCAGWVPDVPIVAMDEAANSATCRTRPSDSRGAQ